MALAMCGPRYGSATSLLDYPPYVRTGYGRVRMRTPGRRDPVRAARCATSQIQDLSVCLGLFCVFQGGKGVIVVRFAWGVWGGLDWGACETFCESERCYKAWVRPRILHFFFLPHYKTF